MNVRYLMKMWHLFKAAKTPNYDHLRWAIKGEMIQWADRQRCWIEDGVYFNNKSLNEWITLKFNSGNSTTLYSSAEKGISILNSLNAKSVLAGEKLVATYSIST